MTAPTLAAVFAISFPSAVVVFVACLVANGWL